MYNIETVPAQYETSHLIPCPTKLLWSRDKFMFNLNPISVPEYYYQW